MKDHYIQAILEMLKKGTDVHTVLQGFSSVLKRRGHERLHASVLRGVLRMLAYKTAQTGTTVTVAHEAALTSQKDAIAAAIRELGGGTAYSTIIDATIIGGVIVEHNNTRIDTSYKSQLVQLYLKVTK